jgi:hypothetical protein
MRQLTIFIVLISVTLFSFRQGGDEDIKCDGVIDKKEWEGSIEYSLTDGGRVLYKRVENVLYIAMISKAKSWGHVYISNGESIKILHASAALGSILYKSSNGAWVNTDTVFKWEFRDRVFNDESSAKMNEYYKKNGWVANNINIGDGKTIEFRIDLMTMSKKIEHIAFVMADYDVKLQWHPSTLNDDTVFPKLVQGYASANMNFKPDTWRKIE